MKCENIHEKFSDYLTEDLAPEARQEVQDHIASCKSCREELENLTAIWAKLGVLPVEQPSGALRQRFYAMLEEARNGSSVESRTARAGRILAGWREWLNFRRPGFVASFSTLLLLLGLGGGWLLSGGRASGTRIAALEQEVWQFRQTAALSLLSQPSASERLQGVSYSAEVKNPNIQTVGALVDTLNTDPSPNVRLAAVDALYLFRNQPGVKSELVRALASQNSPLVQVALIDLLVEIRERRAIDAFKALVATEDLNPEVKKRAEEGLQTII